MVPGLYEERFEHDNCGIGAVVNIKGIKTHKTVDNALKIVENLEHRAGKDAEGKTGDGVGILLQISHKFFKKAAAQCGITLGDEREYGVGMFFFPQDELSRAQAKKMFEIIVEKEGMKFLGWRRLPINPKESLASGHWTVCPVSMQCFIEKAGGCGERDWILTGSFMWHAGFLNRVMMIPMWYRSPAGPSFTRACSW